MASMPLVVQEEEARKPSGVDLQEKEVFVQHDDDDVIIPDRHAVLLVWSAQLLLLSAIFAFVYDYLIMGGLLLFVWATSIWHWRAPRFSSNARIMDYLAVASSVLYGSYLAVTLRSRTFTLIWFLGLAIIGVIFSCNEYAYYVQCGRDVLGCEEEGDKGGEDNFLGLPYCPKYTHSREWVYRRTVLVHMVCVHIAANVLALTIIIGSVKS